MEIINSNESPFYMQHLPLDFNIYSPCIKLIHTIDEVVDRETGSAYLPRKFRVTLNYEDN